MVGIILAIIIMIILALFSYACCVISSECEKWEELNQKEAKKKVQKNNDGRNKKRIL